MNQSEIYFILNEWKKRLYLHEWDFDIDWDTPAIIDDEECGSKNYAQIWVSKDYFDANLKLSADWQSWTVEEANLNLVHELLHVKSRDTRHTIEYTLQGQLHRDVYDIIRSGYNHAEEAFLEAMARILINIGGSVKPSGKESTTKKTKTDQG